MESGTTLTVALLPEPAFISPSETVMAHSPSQRPMTLAGIGTSNLMSSGISVATSTPPILLNSAGPWFRILFLRVDGVGVVPLASLIDGMDVDALLARALSESASLIAVYPTMLD